MTVHEFVMMLMDSVEYVDMSDTAIHIRTPDGSYQPLEVQFTDTEEDGDTLVIVGG